MASRVEAPDMLPAHRVIAKFGSAYKLARALSVVTGRTVTTATVSRWRYPRPRGSGGLIPQAMHHDVARAAVHFGIEIESIDLVCVRIVDSDDSNANET